MGLQYLVSHKYNNHWYYIIWLKQFISNDFLRKPRSMIELDRWKATEFRKFLLYAGPIALKKILSSEIYSHFLTLRMGVAILMDSDNAERNTRIQYVKDFLQYFLENSYQYYGNTFNVYNVHNLIHIVDDTRRLECTLDEIPCFQFENYFHFLKKG